MKAEAHREGEAGAGEAGRNLAEAVASAEADLAARWRTKAGAGSGLMEAVCERGNLWLAYQRVVENKGAAGVDNLGVSELKDHLRQHWPAIKARLLAGEYIPAPVRRVDIPKPQGGVRTLGIPTVVDRLIQQALNQVLTPIFEPDFSEASYGHRPGRNAHQALQAARQYVAASKRWVVDIDLEQFFDRVNHDLLMGKLAQKIDDVRALKLIRRYLEAGTGGARRLGAAETTLPPVAALETPLRTGAQPDAARIDGGTGMALGVQSTRPVVERGREPPARGLPEILV